MVCRQTNPQAFPVGLAPTSSAKPVVPKTCRAKGPGYSDFMAPIKRQRKESLTTHQVVRIVRDVARSVQCRLCPFEEKPNEALEALETLIDAWPPKIWKVRPAVIKKQ